MRTAFKEWAVVADSLARGGQVFILRKGGIHEGCGGFAVEHPEFLLFPTLFHQQRASVISSAQARFDELAPRFPAPGTIRIGHWARVVEWRDLRDPAALGALRGQHIWTDETLRGRFAWGRAAHIFALAVRVYRLPASAELPDAPAYGGCKSWIALGREIDTEGSVPVLDDQAFESRLARFRESLHPAAA